MRVRRAHGVLEEKGLKIFGVLCIFNVYSFSYCKHDGTESVLVSEVQVLTEVGRAREHILLGICYGSCYTTHPHPRINFLESELALIC